MNDNQDTIFKVFLKPAYDTRTFESRLLFLKDIFENTFSKSEIMGRCILYKLNGTYDTYQENINRSAEKIVNNNPLTMLTRLNKLN